MDFLFLIGRRTHKSKNSYLYPVSEKYSISRSIRYLFYTITKFLKTLSVSVTLINRKKILIFQWLEALFLLRDLGCISYRLTNVAWKGSRSIVRSPTTDPCQMYKTEFDTNTSFIYHHFTALKATRSAAKGETNTKKCW